jgi:hypothetical protein
MQHPDTLPTIDRLNIKAKFGIHADVLVRLDTVEQMFFNEMMRTETFEQVVDLAKRIYDHARLPKVQTPPPGAPTNPVPQDNSDDMTSDRGGGGIEEASDENPEPGEGSNTNVEPGDRQEGNEGEGQNESGSVPTDTEQPTEEDAPESVTERAMTRIVTHQHVVHIVVHVLPHGQNQTACRRLEVGGLGIGHVFDDEILGSHQASENGLAVEGHARDGVVVVRVGHAGVYAAPPPVSEIRTPLSAIGSTFLESDNHRRALCWGLSNPQQPVRGLLALGVASGLP